MDWSALPLDVFLNIASYQAFDFYFILAVSGVCSTWRWHSSWLNRLTVWPHYDSQGKLTLNRVCGRHGADFHLCDCLHNSISMFISRLREVRYLEIRSLNFRNPVLQAAHLRDSDWEKLSGSLLELDVIGLSSRALEFIFKCSKLTYLHISDEGMDDFFSEQADRTLPPLENLRSVTLKADLTPSSVGYVHKFLTLCPNVKEIEIKPNSYKKFSGEHVWFEVPSNIDYDLTLDTSPVDVMRLTANTVRRMKIRAGDILILESAERLQELEVSATYLLFTQTPEEMKHFWRLILTGSWQMHDLTSACGTSPITKRLCLDNSFNFFDVYRDDSDKLECYWLFSNMFRGGQVDELELSYGFLLKMWVNEEQEGVMAMIEDMPQLIFLVLDLEVQPEKELDIPRFADAVELLVRCCGMEWISLSFTDDVEEDVNFHRDCFNKHLFSIVAENIMRYGTPQP